MEILIDDSWIGSGGIGRFSVEVKKRIIFSKAFKIPGSPSSALATLKLPWFMSKETVTFLPGYIPPIFSLGKYVLTIHDLNHIDRPENSSLLKKIFYYLVVKRGCKKAYKILTVSEFSRQRVVRWADVAPDKVINVGNGVCERFNANVEPYNIDAAYFLCVGNRKAHKNEARVIEAFASAELDEGVKLVFNGEADPFLEKLVKKHNLTSRVDFIGKVPEESLPSLYKGAKGLLFPSLYEGFGLPVLEAMACGTPVITSNVTSLPEVAGNAAILINPTDTNELIEAIERLENNPDLRNELVAKGYERVSLFTWEKTAQKVQEVLDSARNA
ncbi:glycosyltransferase family 4 protein [Chromohalobacter israelensis]|uniref:glycosyltransferase family 4 protein n=1 Tax=Chromohalobacter israelensis TaxID=141390 RepID=UPI00068CC206|nr:glycosyltransferase family 1 protein [Chromohalobacter israelensis]MDF9435627.1 glycosyltransferase family 4 protein [Chromohalobacter israelensis]